MFSGGRDSTLAAARLGAAGVPQVLVTVSSGHLHKISEVTKRLRELRQLLQPETLWVRVDQPVASPEDLFLSAPTCFPCHRAYTSIGVSMATHFGASTLAFGYTRYQSDWPEQTPQAVTFLRNLLADINITLVTPVYDVSSKSEASAELTSLHLSPVALEQKCSIQINNRVLTPEQYQIEFDHWAHALRVALSRPADPPAVLAMTSLSELED